MTALLYFASFVCLVGAFAVASWVNLTTTIVLTVVGLVFARAGSRVERK